MSRTSFIRMVQDETCRKDKETAKETSRSSVLKRVSGFEQLRVILLGFAVLLGKWKETVRDNEGVR